MYALDANDEILDWTTSGLDGNLSLDLPESTDYLKISHLNYGELHIQNINNIDTFKLNRIYLVEAPSLILVQLKGVSKGKERRYQKQ